MNSTVMIDDELRHHYQQQQQQQCERLQSGAIGDLFLSQANLTEGAHIKHRSSLVCGSQSRCGAVWPNSAGVNIREGYL